MSSVPRDPGLPPPSASSPKGEDLATELEQHVRVLAEEIGERNVTRRPKALEAAARYLEERLADTGLEVTVQDFEVRGVPCRNLAVEVSGRAEDGAVVTAGAHYDSAEGTPGANDNATGTAALLVLARRLREARPEAGLRFVLFPNEEPPFFRTRHMGSRVYARACRERGEKIRAMVCLETLGCYTDRPGSQRYPPLLRRFYPDTGNFLALVTRLRDAPLLRRALSAFREGSPFPVEGAALPAFLPGIAWSDHWAFWKAGFPALMATDTAFYRYPHYHLPSDTADKVDFLRLARVTLGLTRVLEALAGKK